MGPGLLGVSVPRGWDTVGPSRVTRPPQGETTEDAVSCEQRNHMGGCVWGFVARGGPPLS